MQQDSSQKTIIIATLSFIVGFGLAWLIAINKGTMQSTSKEKGGEATSSEMTGQMMTPGNVISVKDQPEGTRVKLDTVTLEAVGWVVIHEDESGVPGRILGAQIFDKGTSEMGVVELLRGTMAGNAYYAMLHDDNGDHAFDPKKDLPLKDAGGAMIMAKFFVTQPE